MDPAPLADIQGTIVTFTVDRMVYSPSPPVVFAVVDFDGGGRLPVELTDADADEIEIGQRGEMTFQVVIETMAGHDLNHLGQIEKIVSQP